MVHHLCQFPRDRKNRMQQTCSTKDTRNLEAAAIKAESSFEVGLSVVKMANLMLGSSKVDRTLSTSMSVPAAPNIPTMKTIP